MHLARRVHTRPLSRRGLDSVADYYGISIDGRHRALGDAEATALALVEMLSSAEKQGVTNWGQLRRWLSRTPKKSARARKRERLGGLLREEGPAADETTPMLIAETDRMRVHTVNARPASSGRWRDVRRGVPKPLWTRRIPADERNRIPLAMRCLLIELDGITILVDNGLGNKEDDRFQDIYGVENRGDPTRLEDSLRSLGIEPGDIDLMVNTHLHFDHAGGNTLRSGGDLRASFPNARYVMRRGEWEVAHSDNPRIRASYLTHNFQPLAGEGKIDFIDEDTLIAPGVRLVSTPGHTAFHQSVLVEMGEETVFYLGDLVPTRAHVGLPWIMAYDLDPLATLDQKSRWLTRAADEGMVARV